MENHTIGIVTVLYNSETVLEDFIRTLNEQTYKNFVLYLIDNNSLDSSVEKGKEYAKNVDFECKWFLQNENLGVAEGNNIGIKAALADNCEYVLLANNDIVLEKNAIQNLLDGLCATNGTMAVPKIYYWDNPQKIWMAGGRISKISYSTYHRGENELDEGQYNKKEEVEYAPTCFMLINATVFARVGLMNKNYFVYYDDTDFVWRSVKLGVEKLVYIPESTIWHKVSSCTGGKLSNFSLRYLKRNQIYFVMQYCKRGQKILFYCYSFLYFILKTLPRYNLKQIKIILEGYREGFILYKRLKSNL